MDDLATAGDGVLSIAEFAKGMAGTKSTTVAMKVADSISMFLPEAALRQCGHIPRRGCNPDFVHEITGLRNENICKKHKDFNASKTCFVFISHRWLRPGNGARGHPDDDSNSKFKVILKALDKLRGPYAPVPEHFQFAVWLDFGCIDQACAALSSAGTLFSCAPTIAAFFLLA